MHGNAVAAAMTTMVPDIPTSNKEDTDGAGALSVFRKCRSLRRMETLQRFGGLKKRFDENLNYPIMKSAEI